MSKSNTEQSVQTDGFDNLEHVGDFEPIDTYFTTKPNPNPDWDNSKDFILTKGDSIKGTFEKKFQSGVHEYFTFLIRLPDGKLGSVRSSKNLNNPFTKDMLKVALGSKVKITFQGHAVIKSGPGKGKETPNFSVQAETRLD